MGGKDALAQTVATDLEGLFLPECVPLDADAARRLAFVCTLAY